MGNRRTSGLAAGWQSLGRYGSSRQQIRELRWPLIAAQTLILGPRPIHLAAAAAADLADLGAKDGMLLDGGGSSFNG